MKQTLYDFIGVGRYAADAEVKAAILKKANVQRESGATDQFDISLLKQASEVLLNPDKRRSYDRSMEEGAVQAVSTHVAQSWVVNYGVLLLCLPIAMACGITLLTAVVMIPAFKIPLIVGLYSVMTATTGILAALETSKNKARDDGDDSKSFVIFLGALIVWPIFLPIYFSRRSEQGFPRQTKSALIAVVLTVFNFGYPLYIAAKQQKELELRVDQARQRSAEMYKKSYDETMRQLNDLSTN